MAGITAFRLVDRCDGREEQAGDTWRGRQAGLTIVRVLTMMGAVRPPARRPAGAPCAVLELASKHGLRRGGGTGGHRRHSNHLETHRGRRIWPRIPTAS